LDAHCADTIKAVFDRYRAKVFNHLSEPRPAETMAKTIGAHQENTRLFFDGLAASDLVVKKGSVSEHAHHAGISGGRPPHIHRTDV
jgi:hypothetical protein